MSMFQRIPYHFRKQHGGSLASKVLITTPQPKWGEYEVELTTGKGGKVCFGGAGWSTFVEEHSVKKGDHIIFRYDGDSRFSVFSSTVSSLKLCS